MKVGSGRLACYRHCGKCWKRKVPSCRITCPSGGRYRAVLAVNTEEGTPVRPEESGRLPGGAVALPELGCEPQWPRQHREPTESELPVCKSETMWGPCECGAAPWEAWEASGIVVRAPVRTVLLGDGLLRARVLGSTIPSTFSPRSGPHVQVQQAARTGPPPTWSRAWSQQCSPGQSSASSSLEHWVLGFL